MRVLVLVPNLLGFSPGQRGSIELWEKILNPEGIELEFAPFETEVLHKILYQKGNYINKTIEMIRSYLNRFKLLRNLEEFDAVFIYREAALIGPAILEKFIAKKKPIIYQLDDPLFMPYISPANGYLSHLKFFGKIKEIIKISKVVIANSTHIRDYSLQFNKNVWQIPSVVDTSRYIYKAFSEKPEKVCVGWSGSPTTTRNLKMIEKPLQTLSESEICKFHFIGGEDFGLEKVKYTAQKWNEASEVEDLRKMHIGLVPLPENSWNRYKFIMKTAQYMALGIVPVGSPIASNPEVIRHGENGFLASTDEEWVNFLKILINEHELRNKMSEQAAADAKLKYSLEANTQKIISAFKSALN